MSAHLIADISQRLTDALAPVELEVLDEADKHKGHANEGKGHFHVRIASCAFKGLAPLERHRLVYAALAGLMASDIHALSIDARIPLSDH